MIHPWWQRLRDFRRRFRNRHSWEKRWASEEFSRPWLGRGVSPEVISAVEEKWFPTEGKAIDLGCGEGEIAAWLAEQGFASLGVDIAPAAVERARARFPQSSGRLEFRAHDLCVSPPPGGPFRILVDRGCYHQISDRDLTLYGRHLSACSAPDAKLLLLHKAFRNGQPTTDTAEKKRVTDRVTAGLHEGFVIERCDLAFLDFHHGADPTQAMPGLAFWMRRRQPELPR